MPHIEASKFEGGAAWVTFDDHRRGNNAPYLFQTADYGRTWTSLVTADIEPFNFVHVIEQDPVSANLLFLGTEHGLYVTLDGGRKWHLWRHGFPRVPTLALIVHPRDPDLVIATHGRAAYVLDDVRPLRALAAEPAIAQKALHVFEMPPATRHEVAQVDGIRFLADAMFIGENRPYGALVTYYVGGGRREMAADGGSDTAKVTIEVLDEAGAIIRRFQGPAKPGINRAAWDLRRDGFRRPRGQQEATPSAFLPAGPPVLAGRYTVRVKHQSQEATGHVEVRDDPRFTVPVTAQREKLDFIMTVGQRQEVAAEAVDRVRDARRAVDRAVEQVQANRGAADSSAKALESAANDLKKALTAAEELFTGPQEVQGIVRAPDAVLPQLGQVYGPLSSSRDAPTEAQRRYLRLAEEDLQRALERTNQVFAQDVAPFRERVQAANVDFFPAQEPLTAEWRQRK